MPLYPRRECALHVKTVLKIIAVLHNCSFARNNPDLDVWFMLTSDVVDNTGSLPSALLNQYRNINLLGMRNLHVLFKSTPAYSFFLSQRWTQGRLTSK